MSGILGQLAPAAQAWTDLYNVPLGVAEIAVRVIVTNRGAGNTTFRCALSENGEAIANKQWVAADKPIEGNDTGSTIGFILSGGDIVRVYAGNANLSFTATGT